MDRRELIRAAAAGALVASGIARSESRTPEGGSARSIETFVATFLKAFEDLDLDAFMACFAAGATVFFPTPEPPQRFDGRSAVREHFSGVFATIRSTSTATAPPFHQLTPERLLISALATDSAVVTFELHNAARIARRTLVLARQHGAWAIAHLHASNVPVAT